MRRLYTVASKCTISCLGGIHGPLTTPTKMELTDVLAMVKKNYVVYQHNPVDLTEKVRVTRSNANSITFKNTRADYLARRALNMSIQQDNAPMKVEVKEKPVLTEKPDSVPKKMDKKEEKVSKPDAFTVS